MALDQSAEIDNGLMLVPVSCKILMLNCGDSCSKGPPGKRDGVAFCVIQHLSEVANMM